LTAAVPHLVVRSQFTAANALLQSTTSLGIVLGPMLSGLGIAALSSQDVLCINAVTYIVSASLLLPVSLPRIPLAPIRALTDPSSTLKDLIEGFRFAKRPIILLLIVTAALYSFGTSAFSTLFPVFGRKMLDLGPVEVGYLWSALGIGLLLMSIGLVRLTEWDLWKRWQVIATSSAISGIALFALATEPDRFAAALLMGVIGGGLAGSEAAWMGCYAGTLTGTHGRPCPHHLRHRRHDRCDRRDDRLRLDHPAIRRTRGRARHRRDSPGNRSGCGRGQPMDPRATERGNGVSITGQPVLLRESCARSMVRPRFQLLH
ncbi:MAG: hypothetical protein C4294_11625, partial [Nitrospiraceae bacterium]